MTIFSFFTLLGGLAFFIYGMSQMSQSLERISGDKMEVYIDKLTSNRLLGLVLGCFITIAIQSSSAVTVMLVGLVNSGLMNLSNTVGIIMGSNIGTTITAWIMSLIGVTSDNTIIKLLKPESFSPLLAFIGIALMMLAKAPKKKEIGNSFLGFAVLMFGMTLMSSSVAPLASDPDFSKLMTAFKNPLLGVATGLVVTAVIQSSAASVGMLQALSMTGSITYGIAIPIIFGQNIGTCATAILSSFGASRNAKRVAAIHLSFNIIGTVIFMVLFYALNSAFSFSFVDSSVNPVGIAFCHSIFNIGTTAILLPFANALVKIAEVVVGDNPQPQIAFLDERVFNTPSIAIAKCDSFSAEMAELAKDSVVKSIENFFADSDKFGGIIQKNEERIDIYEDRLDSYLVKLSAGKISPSDNAKIAKMLYSIGNMECISDYALTLVKSAEVIRNKKLPISQPGKAELTVLSNALTEIVNLTVNAYKNTDAELAEKVEPLNQVIDTLVRRSRENHFDRIQAGICTLKHGFVVADTLNCYERISDHCSNIAVAILASGKETFQPHNYLKQIKSGNNPEFQKLLREYQRIYIPDIAEEGKE